MSDRKHTFRLELSDALLGEIERIAKETKSTKDHVISMIVLLHIITPKQDPRLAELGKQIIDLVDAHQGVKHGGGIDPEAIQKLIDAGHSFTSIGAKLGVHRSTVQRALARATKSTDEQ